MTTKVYDSLTSDAQSTIKKVVNDIKKGLTIDGVVDLVLLMATLEQLNEAKKSIKEEAKEIEKEKNEKLRLRAELIGKQYANTLQVGELITFKYGTGGKLSATLPLEKVGDKTIQVTYTADMLPAGSKTAKRNIRFDKLVVPESFLAEIAA